MVLNIICIEDDGIECDGWASVIVEDGMIVEDSMIVKDGVY